MAGTDPILELLIHEVTVEEYTGRSAYGDSFGPARVIPARIDGSQKMIRDAQGNTVIAGQVVFAQLSQAGVPLGSRVTLPAPYAPTVSRVLAKEVHDDTDPLTPRHTVLFLG